MSADSRYTAMFGHLACLHTVASDPADTLRAELRSDLAEAGLGADDDDDFDFAMVAAFDDTDDSEPDDSDDDLWA